MSSTGIENRRHTRLPIKLEFQLVIGEQSFSGITGNISLSGAYLTSITPLLPHEMVSERGTLVLQAPAGGIPLNCEVVYIGDTEDERFPSGAGIIFCGSDEETVAAIWNLTINHFGQET